MWIFYAFLAALFAALTAIFAKLGVSSIPSNLATAIRTVVVLLLVWGIVFVKGETKEIASISKAGVFFLVISGVATGLSWIFYFKALELGNVSKVAAIDKLSVALVIILAAIFLNEHISLKTGIGATLIIAGTLVMIWK